MKQVMRFSVDGQTVDVPRDELEEFQAAAADHGAKPDEVQGIRVTGADGRAQDVEVPTSEMSDFEAAASEHGATFEPMRTVKMNDGSVRKMSVGELSQFLRSDAYLKSDDHKETVSQLAQRGLDEGSVGWSRVGGFFRGLGYGAWQGAEAAANKIVKAIPETALDIDAAAGHVLKGVSKLGDNAVTRSIGRLGEATVQTATAAKAWLDEKSSLFNSSTGDRLGYEDWSTAFSDFIGNVAGMAYKFAPGMSTGAPMGAKAVATMDAKARAALGAKVVAESGGRLLPKAGALAKIAPTDLMGNAVAVSKLQKIGAYARAALGGNFGAYMETVFGSDGINAYAAMYDAAIENGMMPRQAAKIGGEAFLLNYFGGRVMMRAGGMADGIKSPMWRFLAGGEAISDVMALQAAGNKGLENEATGRPVTEGMGGALWDGKMEGLLFHGLNAVPGAILQKVENRAAYLRHERYRRGFMLDMLKEADGAAELYTMMSSDKLDAAIRARREVLARQEPTAGAVGTEQGKPSVGTEQGKTAAEQGKAAAGAASGATAAGAEQGKASAGTEQGKAATGAKKKVDFVRLAIAAGVPEVMSRAEMNNLVDALARQRDALNERVRLQMSDERAEALSATIDGPVKALLDEKRLDPKDVNDACARIWLKASEKITDASSLDDPDFRQKLVESATREVVGEMSREKQVQADERSRLRGAPVSAQVGEIEERHITSWEDAEADGLIGKDEKGRWTGGMRQALNIAINGTDRLKAEVRDGKMDGEVAEDLISAAYCELGGRPSDERALLVDRVLDFADGNAESARRLMDKIAAQERSSDVPLLDELKRLEDEVTREMEAGIGASADGPEAARPPQTAYEGAVNAERLKGTELKSRDGGVMGCQRFPEVRVEISQEGIRVDGLTDDLISRPENAADAAALLKRLNDIAERNGLTIDLRDANAKAAADALLDEINRGGLEAAQAKLDTRAKLFGLLFKTTLGNGVTYDEASFRAALKKTSNGRPFIDRHGNIYGMTDGEGVVHFNPAALNFNTPIHEYGHLALEAIRGINPALWQRGKELVRNSDYFKEIKGSSETEGNEYAYLKGRDDAICDEALATLIGDRGERLVEGTRLGAELKAWLKEVWKAFKGALGLADLTEEQIERMTLGEFVDAVNAELLKGSEFGTRKRAPLSKVAIRRYDETNGSGSNGLLRWKNDRGYLFALPVDMERTQPGGRVVLARDDANVTDWIERRLAGLELRLSESGKVYVKGRNGFEGELADVFGRYPTIGQNDGLAAQIAQETGRAEWAGATAEELVAGLAKDRASYGAWAEARAAGTGADALAAREEAAARAEAEGAAERRWQDSGMGVVEYIRDMAERGEPGFDLDWETAREIERERTQGLLKNLEEVGLLSVARVGQEKPFVLLDRPNAIDWNSKEKVREYLTTLVGRGEVSLAESRRIRIGRELPREYTRSRYAEKAFRNMRLRKLRGKTAQHLDELIVASGERSGEQSRHKAREGGVYYRRTVDFGVMGHEVKRGYTAELLTYEAGGEERLYDLVNIKEKPTLTDSLRRTDRGALEILSPNRADLTGGSIANRGAERNGGAGLAPRAQDGGTSAAARAAATGQGARPRAQGGTPRAQGEAKFSVGRLYTGSAADYEKPSLHAVGTGEGNQVYGWGLYASDRRGVAEGYANSDAKRRASTPDEMWPKYKGKFDSELEHDPVRTFALKYVAREGSVDAAIQFLRTDDWTERAAPKAREAAEWLEKNRDDVTPPQTPSEHLYEQTWFTDRAPGDESHLLKWYEPVSEEQLKWVKDASKEFSASDRAKFARVLAKPLNYNTRTQYGKKPLVLAGEDIYRAVTHVFEYGEARAENPQRAASEFLARAGIDGVKYPVDSYGGKAVKDGEEAGWNYVSFRDDNIRVDHKWRDGEAVFHVGRVNPKLREDIREAIAGDAKGNPIGRRKEVSFSEMPATLKAVGLPDLPIRTRTDIVRKLKREHRFTEQQIAALPAAYGQPVAVFADGKAFVILTEMQIATRKGTEKPVMVVLRENVDRNGRHEFLASAYPREEANENFYWGLARNGGMLFLDKNKVAVIGLSGRTISTLNKQADGNRVKTPEDLSSLVSRDSIANRGAERNGGAGLAPRAQDGGAGAAARAAATGQGAGPRAQDGTTRVQGEGRGATGPGEGRFSVGPGGPGRALVNKALFVAGRARVADDAGVGEQTPGSLALSRELSTQGVTPLSQLGTLRKISLPVSAMEFVRKRLTGDAAPAAVVRRLPGGRAAAHTAAGRLYISADIYGTVDKSDMAKEKARLKANGFFRNEDPGWCATQYPAAIRAEQRRSDDALANQLDNLGSRRARGLTDGGQAAATQVFADELARIVLEMPQQTAGVLGSVQTIGKSVRTEALRRFAPSAGAHGTGQNGANAGQGAQGQTAEAAARAEAGGFLDWSYGGPLTDPATGSSVSRGDVSTMGELANAMFGKWLVMPREMETRAPTWSQVIEATIANDPRLKDAFEEVSRHFTTEQASGYLIERIRKQQSKDTEAELKKLQWEARNPIGAGSWIANAQEGLFVGFHDKFAPVTVRISQKLKDYKAAQKALLRRMPNAADRAAICAETDRFIGEVEQRLHRLELSRTACERGAFNEGNRYFLEMLRLEGKAYERWGLTEEDRSLYLRLQRVVETQGRAASDGMSARQAQIALDEMKTRLGAAKYAKLEQYGREFFGIHERELLNDRRLEAAFGKAFVDYLRTQEHYVATKRTLSVDELAAVDAARAAARAAGVAGGDDMVSAAYAYGGARGAGDVCGEAAWTMPMKGSMAAAQEARSATWMKVDRLMHFLRRNQMMIDLRDALLKAGVEGVRDLRRTDGAEWPDNERYGHLNYMVDGEKRTLVVPRQIADAFRVDPDAAQWITKANGLVRALYIDYNPAYWAQNVKRNQDSIEKNMPGMRETYAKTALRAVAPGMGAASDLVLQALVRNVPQAGCLFSEHTVYAHIPKAERYARILEKTVEWQRELWAAEDAGDVAKVLQMNEDFAGVMEMLKGNFLVPMAQAYRGPETNGFAFEAFSRKGLKSFEQVDAENRARSKGRKLLDAINVFKKNQAQQEHEDVLAKVVAYLHDRMEYGAIRSVEESGLIVKKNVSIAEGERAGRLKRPMQQFVAQFFNMVEKGVVRHWNALRERPGETLIADGKVWMGRLIGGLFASGALMKWMLDDSDGDEEKAKAKYGFVFGYAKAFHRAYQNCSEYVKENYNITPIWNGPDGYTSIVIGGALTDEDKLIVPTADYASGMVAHLMEIAPAPSIGKAIANSTVKAVTPDLQLAGPIVTLLRDTVEATLIDNPTDYFRGAPMYDQRLWENRNESWEMRGQFAAAVGAKLWNDFGGRSLLAMDVNGVDNGRGSAPETLESVLRRLPVVSPAIGRMIKIQVGSPAKRGATIREQEAKTRSLIGLLSEKLLKGRKGDVGWHERDFDGFQKQIEDWTKTYGFTPEDVSKLRMRYYNAWIQFKNREGYDRQELARLFAQGRKQGLSEEQLWIMLGDL